MDAGHLNIFVPYTNKPLAHEDQLTRAFLILVRSVRVVEAMLLELLVNRMAESGIDERPALMTTAPGGLETIETQVWSTTKARLEGETGRVISVMITDSKLKPEHCVKRTERVAVYDGFVKYKPNWVFVIENKPDKHNVWWEQLSSSFNANYEVEKTPLVLTWSEILGRLNALRDNALLYDAAEVIVGDFLAFVWEYFPELNAYASFKGCKGNKFLLSRRCMQIMAEAELGTVEYHRGWYHSIRMVHKPGIKEVALYPDVTDSDTWKILLDLHPGDTMEQARSLFATIDSDKVALLGEQGWIIEPNFHLAYRSSNLHWGETRLSAVDYIAYWKRQVAERRLRQILREEWQSRWQEWWTDGIISERDIDQINAHIASTKIPKLNVCP
ncbi:MAG: hypothetical protein NTY53_12830, partial [Kiritimatiellaeota bacterium]|nr:hypothetical protein [Kiritimatiellota bacterium]